MAASSNLEQSASLAAPGTLPSVHTVYKGNSASSVWTKEPPKGVGPPVEDATSAQHALVARYLTNTDDPSIPAMTLRVWVIGMIWAIIIPGMNQFFFFRFPAVTVTGVRIKKFVCSTSLTDLVL